MDELMEKWCRRSLDINAMGAKDSVSQSNQ